MYRILCITNKLTKKQIFRIKVGILLKYSQIDDSFIFKIQTADLV